MKKIYPDSSNGIAAVTPINCKPITEQQYAELVERTNCAEAKADTAIDCTNSLRTSLQTGLTTCTVNATSLNASDANLTDIDATDIDTTNLKTDNLTVNNTATIDTLRAENATFDTVNADNLNVDCICTQCINSAGSLSVQCLSSTVTLKATCNAYLCCGVSLGDKIIQNTSRVTNANPNTLGYSDISGICTRCLQACGYTPSCATRLCGCTCIEHGIVANEDVTNAQIDCADIKFIEHTYCQVFSGSNSDHYTVLPLFTNGVYYLEGRTDGGIKLFSIEISNSQGNLMYRWSQRELDFLKSVKAGTYDDGYTGKYEIKWNGKGNRINLFYQSSSTDNTTAPTNYIVSQITDNYDQHNITDANGTYVDDLMVTDTLRVENLEMEELSMDNVNIYKNLGLTTCLVNGQPVVATGNNLDYVQVTTCADGTTLRPSWQSPSNCLTNTNFCSCSTCLTTEASVAHYNGESGELIYATPTAVTSIEEFNDLVGKYIYRSGTTNPYNGPVTCATSEIKKDSAFYSSYNAFYQAVKNCCNYDCLKVFTYIDGNEYWVCGANSPEYDHNVSIVCEATGDVSVCSYSDLSLFCQEYSYYSTWFGPSRYRSYFALNDICYTYITSQCTDYNIVHLGNNTCVHGNANVECTLTTKDAQVTCTLTTPHFTDGGTITNGLDIQKATTSCTVYCNDRLPFSVTTDNCYCVSEDGTTWWWQLNGSSYQECSLPMYNENTQEYYWIKICDMDNPMLESHYMEGYPGFCYSSQIYEGTERCCRLDWMCVYPWFFAPTDRVTDCCLIPTFCQTTVTCETGATINRKKDSRCDAIAAYKCECNWTNVSNTTPLSYDSTTDTIQPTDTIEVTNATTDNLTVTGDAHINGDLYVEGKTITTEEETISTSGDTIVLRQNNASGLASTEVSGVIVHNYDGSDNNAIVGVDNTGTVRIGDATGTDTTYPSIWLNSDGEWFTSDGTVQVTPSGELTKYASKVVEDDWTKYTNAIFTEFDLTDLEPVATRDEVSNMSNHALTCWDASNTEIQTIANPSAADQVLVSCANDDNTFGYKWQDNYSDATKVFRFESMACYNAYTGTIPIGSVVYIDNEDNWVKSEDIQ